MARIRKQAARQTISKNRMEDSRQVGISLCSRDGNEEENEEEEETGRQDAYEFSRAG